MPTRRSVLIQLAAATAGAAVPAVLRAGASPAGAATAPAGRAAAGPGAGAAVCPEVLPGTRNILQWPFARDSIWNMPIGSAATYHDPGWDPMVFLVNGYQVDVDVLILTPNAPLRPVLENNGEFDDFVDRCVPKTGAATLTRIPIPDGFVYHEGSNQDEVKFNSCWTAVRPDGVTISYGSSFARCAPHPAPVLSRNLMSEWGVADGRDLRGPGRHGAHGGSQLSSFGGCLRVGELRPGGARIRHALRIGFGRDFLYRPPDWTPTTHPPATNWVFRWPAIRSDDWTTYHGTDTQVRPGSLYALRPSVTVDNFAASWAGTGHGPAGNLETEPAKQLAWTLQNYGAYHCDATNVHSWLWDVERGTNGVFTDQFRADWGFDVERPGFNPGSMADLRRARTAPPGTGAMSDRWLRDMDRLVARLCVVSNNGLSSIGGGGCPRQPLAPPFA